MWNKRVKRRALASRTSSNRAGVLFVFFVIVAVSNLCYVLCSIVNLQLILMYHTHTQTHLPYTFCVDGQTKRQPKNMLTILVLKCENKRASQWISKIKSVLCGQRGGERKKAIKTLRHWNDNEE